jgi:hypothetical protein
MSVSNVEILLRTMKMKQALSQKDINESVIAAIGEVLREIKRLDDAVQRTRRDIRFTRRF